MAEGLSASQAARRRRLARRRAGLQARRAANRAQGQQDRIQAQERRREAHAEALRENLIREMTAAAMAARPGTLGAALR